MNKPDVVIIGLLNFAGISVLKTLFPFKVICILHGIEAWGYQKNISVFYKFVDKFWAVSSYTKKLFSQANMIELNKIVKIFNTIPHDWGVRNKTHLDYNYFLTVTRLDDKEGYKGVDSTLYAIVRLQTILREKKWKFIIVAAGTDLNRHKEIVNQENLSDIVDFVSGITDEELKNLYADSSFFILPSYGEGFGIVFLEAMAYKKACIGSYNCGTEDVIEHNKTGFLIEPNVEEIQSSLEILIADEEKSRIMGIEGYNKLINEFAFEKFQKKVLSLL